MSARSLLALVAVTLLAGCATVDVYRYQRQPLPSGLAPLEAVRQSLDELESVNWGAHGAGAIAGRARVGADAGGITAVPTMPAMITVGAIRLRYDEIARNVLAVTCFGGVWTVKLFGTSSDEVDFVFKTARAARLFLDAATALTDGPLYSAR